MSVAAGPAPPSPVLRGPVAHLARTRSTMGTRSADFSSGNGRAGTVRHVPFPSPPWQMHAQAWLTLYVLRDTGRADRPPGLYAAAFVDYQPDSPLTYHELLVA